VIARQPGTSVQTVSAWRKRVAQRGAQGLRECERSGRPPRITQESRLQLIASACEAQEPEGRVTPTLDEIVARAIERRIVGRISRSHQMEFPGLTVANWCIVIEAPTSSGTHVTGVR
jgi:transposase